VVACFYQFRECNLDARWVHVCRERTIASEIILDAPDGTPTWVIWNFVSVHLEIVLVSVHIRERFAPTIS
jgi:hypothetical protein